ncbi:MAG: hypothetical protein HY673_00525 [Chloroflexi bacterium]|nr:hypothetical protein [Chloroflexota bacterium]
MKIGPMIVTCPQCGKNVPVKGLGRKKLNIPLKNVLECLRRCHSVKDAARELHCSQGYIFNTLRANGMKVRDVVGGVKCE